MAGHSPLLGYNTNVRHKGKLYHIQTEDSGVKYSHIITHLFADGGRIIASAKTSYVDILEAEDLRAQVKQLMRDQHKAMFIALRDGVHDEEEAPAAPKAAEAPEAPAPPPPVQELAAPTNPAPPPDGALPQPDPLAAVAAAAASAAVVSAPASPTPSAAPRRSPSAPAISLGLDPAPPPDPSRYQLTQPAHPEEQPRSSKPAGSIFGSDLLSEKSLDEVILSYLAEDLDEDA